MYDKMRRDLLLIVFEIEEMSGKGTEIEEEYFRDALASLANLFFEIPK